MAVVDSEETTVLDDISPFLLRPEDVETLSHSAGFTILRDHLAHHYSYTLCDQHQPIHISHLTRWLVVRDALHAMLVPVVELFDRSIALAAAATHATKLEELEYAFTGEARSAFLWLQCFLAAERERDWCYTRGCPACVVEHTLDSEFSVRLLYAACLLSDVHYPFTIEGPTLPSFMFFLAALERALAGDPLFGRDFFERMHPKAQTTRNGIEELIRQCVDLDALLVSSQSATPATGPTPDSSAPASPVLAPLGSNPSAGQARLRVKRSRIARRQMSLQLEEEQWMEEMARRCWDRLAAEGNVTDGYEEGDDGDEEDAEILPSMDTVLKLKARVNVQEVAVGD